MLKISECLIGLAVVMLQSCNTADNRRDQLCGNWTSMEGKPDVLIYKEGEAYKVTVFKRSGIRRRLKPETYLLQEENGNLFMNTGFRIDVSLSLIHIYLQRDSDVGLKIHSFRQMFGHQSKRMKTGVHIQPVFQAHIHADG